MTAKTFEEWAKHRQRNLAALREAFNAGRAAGEVWDCSDCFEEGNKEGYAKGIADAEPIADLLACIVNHATLPDAWYERAIRDLEAFRALNKEGE